MASYPSVRIPELRTDPAIHVPEGRIEDLVDFLDGHRRIVVLTGAGCSTASGIPAYRDPSGRWQRRQPILFHEFVRDPAIQRRYWARSYFGWSVMRDARPGRTHRSLARLEAGGRLSGLVTQNVDGLHQRAGHAGVIELHGGLQRVLCMSCGAICDRAALQQRLELMNPDWSPEVLGVNPDGDAELDERAYPGFRVAGCQRCGGTLKPDVVFFGESVPRERLDAAEARVDEADALLVVGTSLVVWSGYRLARTASQRGIPIAAINDGRTRADDLFDFKMGGECGEVLARAVSEVEAQTSSE